MGDTLLDADITRMLAVAHNRRVIGYGHGIGHSNTSAMIGERPMTSQERRAKAHPPEPPRPTFAPPPDAACLGATVIFYAHDPALALAACRECPAHWPCRYAALEVPNSEQWGVQGGLTAKARIRVRQSWLKLDTSVMRERRAATYRESVRLRGAL